MARVPYLDRGNLTPEALAVHDEILHSRGTVGNAFRALLNSPETARLVGALGAYARYRSKIPPLVRELAILTVARELGCAYEWVHHETHARSIGLSQASIETIRNRTAPRGMPPKEGVFVQYTQELLRSRRPTDATFQAVFHLLGAEGTVDLTVTIGYYLMLAHLLLALEVELESAQPSPFPELR